MTPESVPGSLISEEVEEELLDSLVYQRAPVHLEHEIFLTDLPAAA